MISFPRIRTVSLFLLVLFFLSNAAQACLQIGAPAERIPEIIEEAVYIGKVQIYKFRKIGKGLGQREEALIIPIQPYKGSLDSPIEIIDICCNSCGKGIPPEGTIYEEIIFQRNGKYSLSMKGELLPESAWAELRKRAKSSPLSEQEEKDCRKRGGVQTTHAGENWANVIDCHIESRDFGQICNGPENCEGLCLADHSSEEGFQPNGVYGFPEWTGATLPGRCSSWKDMDGCFTQVKNGKIQEFECRD